MGAITWVALGLVVGALVLLLAAGIRRRLRGRRVRRAMGQISRLETAATESYSTLRGRLRRVDEGGGVAVATVVGQGFGGTASARCASLELEVQGERVHLEGPVEVILGSRETSASTLLHRTDERAYRRVAGQFPGLVRDLVVADTALKLVEADDEVVVAGRLERTGHPDSQLGYRQNAHRWVLSGGGGPAIVAAVWLRRSPLSWFALSLGLGVLGSLLLLSRFGG